MRASDDTDWQLTAPFECKTVNQGPPEWLPPWSHSRIDEWLHRSPTNTFEVDQRHVGAPAADASLIELGKSTSDRTLAARRQVPRHRLQGRDEQQVLVGSGIDAPDHATTASTAPAAAANDMQMVGVPRSSDSGLKLHNSRLHAHKHRGRRRRSSQGAAPQSTATAAAESLTLIEQRTGLVGASSGSTRGHAHAASASDTDNVAASRPASTSRWEGTRIMRLAHQLRAQLASRKDASLLLPGMDSGTGTSAGAGVAPSGAGGASTPERRRERHHAPMPVPVLLESQAGAAAAAVHAGTDASVGADTAMLVTATGTVASAEALAHQALGGRTVSQLLADPSFTGDRLGIFGGTGTGHGPSQPRMHLQKSDQGEAVVMMRVQDALVDYAQRPSILTHAAEAKGKPQGGSGAVQPDVASGLSALDAYEDANAAYNTPSLSAAAGASMDAAQTQAQAQAPSSGQGAPARGSDARGNGDSDSDVEGDGDGDSVDSIAAVVPIFMETAASASTATGTSTGTLYEVIIHPAVNAIGFVTPRLVFQLSKELITCMMTELLQDVFAKSTTAPALANIDPVHFGSEDGASPKKGGGGDVNGAVSDIKGPSGLETAKNVGLPSHSELDVAKAAAFGDESLLEVAASMAPVHASLLEVAAAVVRSKIHASAAAASAASSAGGAGVGAADEEVGSSTGGGVGGALWSHGSASGLSLLQVMERVNATIDRMRGDTYAYAHTHAGAATAIGTAMRGPAAAGAWAGGSRLAAAAGEGVGQEEGPAVRLPKGSAHAFLLRQAERAWMEVERDTLKALALANSDTSRSPVSLELGTAATTAAGGGASGRIGALSPSLVDQLSPAARRAHAAYTGSSPSSTGAGAMHFAAANMHTTAGSRSSLASASASVAGSGLHLGVETQADAAAAAAAEAREGLSSRSLSALHSEWAEYSASMHARSASIEAAYRAVNDRGYVYGSDYAGDTDVRPERKGRGGSGDEDEEGGDSGLGSANDAYNRRGSDGHRFASGSKDDDKAATPKQYLPKRAPPPVAAEKFETPDQPPMVLAFELVDSILDPAEVGLLAKLPRKLLPRARGAVVRKMMQLTIPAATRKITEAVTFGVATRVGVTAAHLIHQAVTKLLLPRLTASLSLSILNTIMHEPADDYACAYCTMEKERLKKEKGKNKDKDKEKSSSSLRGAPDNGGPPPAYCTTCAVAMHKQRYMNRLISFHAARYSKYYGDWFGMHGDRETVAALADAVGMDEKDVAALLQTVARKHGPTWPDVPEPAPAPLPPQPSSKTKK